MKGSNFFGCLRKKPLLLFLFFLTGCNQILHLKLQKNSDHFSSYHCKSGCLSKLLKGVTYSSLIYGNRGRNVQYNFNNPLSFEVSLLKDPSYFSPLNLAAGATEELSFLAKITCDASTCTGLNLLQGFPYQASNGDQDMFFGGNVRSNLFNGGAGNFFNQVGFSFTTDRNFNLKNTLIYGIPDQDSYYGEAFYDADLESFRVTATLLDNMVRLLLPETLLAASVSSSDQGIIHNYPIPPNFPTNLASQGMCTVKTQNNGHPIVTYLGEANNKGVNQPIIFNYNVFNGTDFTTQSVLPAAGTSVVINSMNCQVLGSSYIGIPISIVESSTSAGFLIYNPIEGDFTVQENFNPITAQGTTQFNDITSITDDSVAALAGYSSSFSTGNTDALVSIFSYGENKVPAKKCGYTFGTSSNDQFNSARSCTSFYSSNALCLNGFITNPSTNEKEGFLVVVNQNNCALQFFRTFSKSGYDVLANNFLDLGNNLPALILTAKGSSGNNIGYILQPVSNGEILTTTELVSKNDSKIVSSNDVTSSYQISINDKFSLSPLFESVDLFVQLNGLYSSNTNFMSSYAQQKINITQGGGGGGGNSGNGGSKTPSSINLWLYVGAPAAALVCLGICLCGLYCSKKGEQDTGSDPEGASIIPTATRVSLNNIIVASDVLTLDSIEDSNRSASENIEYSN